MIEEKWIHTIGYDVLVYVSSKNGYCYPLKEANTSCPIVENCRSMSSVEYSTERALAEVANQVRQHLRQAHLVH